MAFLDSLPETAHLSDLFKKFPVGLKPLLEYHDEILRKNGAIPVGQRELIAAYVSTLNSCSFCADSHSHIAQQFDIDPGLIEKLKINIDSSGVDDNLKPILAYVKKLTLTPSKIVKQDIDKILSSGWSEEAVYLAASICALFNFMNRVVSGFGISSDSINKDRFNDGSHLSGSSYKNFGKKMGFQFN